MKPRIMITRGQLDVIRAHGGNVTFTGPGRAIVAGIAVHIQEEHQQPDAILGCQSVGEGTRTTCADCGASIVVHPSSPQSLVKICLRCVGVRIEAARQ